MEGKYIEVKEFHEFKVNQEELIKVLNHSITRISTDLSWIKKIINWQFGIFSSAIIAIITMIITNVI